MKNAYILVIEILREGFLFSVHLTDEEKDTFIADVFDYFTPEKYPEEFSNLILEGKYHINGNHLYAGIMDSFRTNGAKTVYLREWTPAFDSKIFLRERENCSSPLDHLSVSDQDHLSTLFPSICNLAN